MIKLIKHLKDGSVIIEKSTACGPSEVIGRNIWLDEKTKVKKSKRNGDHDTPYKTYEEVMKAVDERLSKEGIICIDIL